MLRSKRKTEHKGKSDNKYNWVYWVRRHGKLHVQKLTPKQKLVNYG